MENPGEVEGSKEQIPSRENILLQIRKWCEVAEPPLRELADNNGIYLLEIRALGEAPGEFTDYIYQREGRFPNGIETAKTVLEAVYFINNSPEGGDVIAEYDDATGEWVEIKN